MFLVETLSLTDVFVMQYFREIYIDSFRCEWREGGKKLFKQLDERNLEIPAYLVFGHLTHLLRQDLASA